MPRTPLNSTFGRAASSATRRTSLDVEQLEPREVPAVTARLSGGVLSIRGTPADDSIVVRQTSTRITVLGVTTRFAVAAVSRLSVQALDGNDLIDVRGLVKQASLNGGSGGDTFLIDLAGKSTLPGYDVTDRVDFGQPGVVVKSAVGVDGSLYALDSARQLWRNGTVKWQAIDDFAIDAQGRVLQLQNTTLSRSTLPGSSSGWVTLGRDVRKFAVLGNTVYTLDDSRVLAVNGVSNWEAIDDFTFDTQGRMIQFTAGTLLRSRLAGWHGGWDTLGRAVQQYAVRGDSVYALDAHHQLWVNGILKWQEIDGFAIDARGRMLQLTGHQLIRSKLPGYSSGWDTLARSVTKFAVFGDTAYALDSSRQLSVEGVVKWQGIDDFAVDSKGRVLQLIGRQLIRSQGVGGSSVWDTLGSQVTEFAIFRDTAYSLDTGAWLSINGTRNWAGILDFAIDARGRMFQLTDGGDLFRSKLPGHFGGWETLGKAVASFAVAPGGHTTYLLTASGVLMRSDDGWLGSFRAADTNVRSFTLTSGGVSVTRQVELSSGGVLTIRGTRFGDSILLFERGGVLSVSINGGGQWSGSASAVRAKNIWGGEGLDRFLLAKPVDLFDTEHFQDADWGRDALAYFFPSGFRSWTEDEILQVDAGLARLQQRTLNSRLLKLSDGRWLTFQRHVSLWTEDGKPALATNDSEGLIRVADRAFSPDVQSSSPVWATVIHEIGHDWDEAGENGSFNFGWFKAQSGYVSNYARKSVREDFAETLVATFLTNALYKPDDAPTKVSYMNRWLDSMSS